MGLLGRFFSKRDMKFINSVSGELMGDIVQNIVTVFKICPENIRLNMYGETNPETGKYYFPGIKISCLYDASEINTEADNFGPDRKQNTVFKFREKVLQEFNLYPEIGDIIFFNNMYYEIDNVVQQQFLGGVPEKSYSIIVNTHYTRLSKLNVMER